LKGGSYIVVHLGLTVE